MTEDLFDINDLDIERLSPADLAYALAVADWYAAHPVEAFVPSPPLGAFMLDQSTRILLRAANRVGKTEHGVCKFAKRMLDYPNRRYRIVGVTWVQTRDVLSAMLAKYLPADSLASGCSFSETQGWSHGIVRLRNGTTCQVKNYEQAPKAHAGADLDGILMDEPPPPPIYEESRKRVMSRNGFLWITATPINQPCGYLKTAVTAEHSPWTEYVVEFSHANCPWYTAEQCEAWIAECRAVPGTFDQTIKGAWEGITLARVFTGYDADSIFDDVAEIPTWAKWGVGIDHGESAGKQVAVLIAYDDKNPRMPRIWIVDECASTTATTPEQDGAAIYDMLRRNGRDVNAVDRWRGDTNSAGKLGPGLKVNDILAKAIGTAAGMHRAPMVIEPPWKGPGSVAHGERLVNAALLRRWLRVHRRCVGVGNTMSHYDGGEDLKHFSDAVRYITYPVLDLTTALPTVRLTGTSPGPTQPSRVY